MSTPLPARSGLCTRFLFTFSTIDEQPVIYLPTLREIKGANTQTLMPGPQTGRRGPWGPEGCRQKRVQGAVSRAQAQPPKGLREGGDDSALQPLHMDAQAGVPVRGALTPGGAEGTGRARLSGPSLGGPPSRALHPDTLHRLFLREPPGEKRLCFRELTLLFQ